jgi:hypothetical protein
MIRVKEYKTVYSFSSGLYTGHTQKNGAVLIVNIIKTAPFFCVCPVFEDTENKQNDIPLRHTFLQINSQHYVPVIT